MTSDIPVQAVGVLSRIFEISREIATVGKIDVDVAISIKIDPGHATSHDFWKIEATGYGVTEEREVDATFLGNIEKDGCCVVRVGTRRATAVVKKVQQ